jgi:hypothetical protein
MRMSPFQDVVPWFLVFFPLGFWIFLSLGYSGQKFTIPKIPTWKKKNDLEDKNDQFG